MSPGDVTFLLKRETRLSDELESFAQCGTLCHYISTEDQDVYLCAYQMVVIREKRRDNVLVVLTSLCQAVA